MSSYEHVLSFVMEHPWAVTAQMRTVIASILAHRLSGQASDPQEIAAALVNRKNLPQPAGGGAVAIIPVYGVIAPRMNMLSEMSGGTTFEKLTGQLREAMADKSVKTIVLDIDSPGGNVAGATEFAREVMRARTKKPIIAQAQYTMASAAYWLASAATEIVAAPSATIGSVGVFAIHNDLSAALESMGVKRTYISAGKHKVSGNETAPLDDESAGRIQAKVNEAYSQFIADISKGRGVPQDAVRSGYGEGDTVGAEEALRLGMVDRIATLDETVARVMSSAPSMERAALAAELPTLDTVQEPSPATTQDLAADARWSVDIERQLWELSL